MRSTDVTEVFYNQRRSIEKLEERGTAERMGEKKGRL